MTAISHETGLNRESLYRSLSKNGVSRLSTFFSVFEGFKFTNQFKITN
nr:hypothetical protein [Bartonella rattimassiliensis]